MLTVATSMLSPVLTEVFAKRMAAEKDKVVISTGALVDVSGQASPRQGETVLGPAGRVFHGVFVTFALPRTERCPPNLKLRFGLEAGVTLDTMILFYNVEILPVFVEFERHDQIELPLDASSVDRAVEWFKQKTSAFTRTYVSMFFNPYYQKGSEVADVVLGRTFPRVFAKGQNEHGGLTYYLLTEESQKPFEQDPARYVGSSQEHRSEHL